MGKTILTTKDNQPHNNSIKKTKQQKPHKTKEQRQYKNHKQLNKTKKYKKNNNKQKTKIPPNLSGTDFKKPKKCKKNHSGIILSGVT